MIKHISHLVIFILIIVLLLSVNKCNGIQKELKANAITLTDTVTYLTNALGTKTATVSALQLEKSELKKLIMSKDAEVKALAQSFSKIKAITKYSEVIKYDTITVFFKDSLPCSFNRTGNIKTKWYAFSYKASQKSFIIDSLTMPNQAIIITGFKRKWFLGNEVLTTQVTHSNPYITVTGITSVEVALPQPWYKKWYVWLAGGITGGLLISK
ncbi:hypothetical protein GR160_08710 [Flavobacterium sp. Sd200]|uniref:DUF6549 family protein n=1 Tax=Flavobacterium sp. Sd200 TaxID=2692211 RepID=UPI00136BF4AA|nr:DUF6549 family protein [Flavobacterium sp. Sd200]MXN91308.1 hypothetical protein [Flavobacterium sp. Sd200]